MDALCMCRWVLRGAGDLVHAAISAVQPVTAGSVYSGHISVSRLVWRAPQTLHIVLLCSDL